MRKAKNENQNSKKVYPILLLANPQDSIFSNEKISKKRRGSFTLIELLVTSSIIMIMLAVTIAYSQRGEGINKVNRMIERLTFDIRRVANLSTQTQEIGDKKICG